MSDIFNKKRKAHEEEFFEKSNKAALEKFLKKSSEKNESTLHCPADGEPLAGEKISETSLYRCPKCSGVWLEKDEIERLLQAAIKNQPAQDSEGGLLKGLFRTKG